MSACKCGECEAEFRGAVSDGATTSTTTEALALVRHLRDRADKPGWIRRPLLSDLKPAGVGLLRWIQSDGYRLAADALSSVAYFDAHEQTAWLRAIDAAIAKLEGA